MRQPPSPACPLPFSVARTDEKGMQMARIATVILVSLYAVLAPLIIALSLH
jgi:hypothetical protein